MATIIAKTILRELKNTELLILPDAILSYGPSSEEIARGRVEITVCEGEAYRYEMTSTSFNLARTNQAKDFLKSNPYSLVGWPRIDGEDTHGRCWTITRLDPYYDAAANSSEATLIAIGRTNNISASAQTHPMDVGRIEVVIPLKDYQMIANEIGFLIGREKLIEIHGTTIWFEFDYETEELHISALYSNKCQQPFLDTWIYEPLQVIFGVPFEPKIAARIPQKKNIATHIHCRGGNDASDDVSTGLWAFASSARNRVQFWRWYTVLFDYFSLYREERSPLFYGNPLTYYYRELHFASQRTIWLRNMAYAATIEAFADLIIPEKKRTLPAVERDSIIAIKAHLMDYSRDNATPKQREFDRRLLEKLHNSLGYARNWSAKGKLLSLVESNILESKHVQSWSRIRNPTMHGELGDIWTTPEGDEDTRNLMDAVARMTCTIIDTEFWE